MKNGFTTGSCAAAAAKAACLMIFSEDDIQMIEITTPAGVRFNAPVEDIRRMPGESGREASCAIRKYSGDDPDVTGGMLIYAKVSVYDDNADRVIIDGGVGIGKVTRPGLDQPVGEYAINSTPRAMIEREVRGVMETYDHHGTAKVTIYAPEGEEIAKKTFNPHLGIEGGISIIGTTGIVEPMSTRAIIDTIRVELRQKKAMGDNIAVITPGNYGVDFMKNEFGYDLDRAVKCSNYIGDAIDIARELGFKKMLLTGHIGKLIKVTGGEFNTHSKVSDRRMELMADVAKCAGASEDVVKRIYECVNTEAAYALMLEAKIADRCSKIIGDRLDEVLSARAGTMQIGCITYSSKYGLIAMTDSAVKMLEEI
ncbi:MAG: cobalt-precorrin-5B (C(1))-methyltransferase CbiD [Lachnospiraceae bacterium]|nr:cobalt-precorrin-5B (C(1))-methyltransferase CbiD [Lachnospiraceae bacterium]